MQKDEKDEKDDSYTPPPREDEPLFKSEAKLLIQDPISKNIAGTKRTPKKSPTKLAVESSVSTRRRTIRKCEQKSFYNCICIVIFLCYRRSRKLT